MIRSAFKLATHRLLPTRRFFSNIYAAELNHVLQEEISIESKLNEPFLYDEISSFLEKNGFLLEEELNSTLVSLKKTIDNYLIDIKFTARCPIINEETDEEEEDESVQFMIVIQKAGEKKGVIIEAFSLEEVISISQIHYSEDIQAYYLNVFTGKSFSSYFGPEFASLKENMQTGFLNFIENLGVNDELASFIERYSEDKEQRLYFKWMNDLAAFAKELS